MQLVHVEEAFKRLKSDLDLCLIHHQIERCVEDHIFVAVLAYCLAVTVRMKRNEPIVSPRGWNWRIHTAEIASFPAREIVVATMKTIYNLGNEQDARYQDLVESYM